MKKKSKKIGLNGTEAGAKWDSIFLCNGGNKGFSAYLTF